MRGYVDVRRLELAAERVEQLELEHLQYDTELVQLRQFTNSALAILGQQNGVELSVRLDTDIIAYNNVCARLLGKQHLVLNVFHLISHLWRLKQNHISISLCPL